MRKLCMLDERLEREKTVREANDWTGTPYVSGQRVKTAGCDCGTLLEGIYLNAGVLTEADLDKEHYPADWFQHTDEEMYLKRVMRHTTKLMPRLGTRIYSPKPGDLVLFKTLQTSRVFNHGAIVLAWPRVMHILDDDLGAREVNALVEPMFMGADILFFTFWESLKAASGD